ncbi:MAG: single-stranded DNA-binding protein [Candidatus Wildermuthbacteria bacterium]|nr:single-stranded DNA-binding protein [Candidatus Wildermuthbacteria bacterium]
MDLNKVFLIGRLTENPEIRTTSSGQEVSTIRIATNRMWTDKQGQKQREAEYHSVVLWGRLAQIAGQYLQKGGLVYIEGRIQTRSWDDSQGQKRYRTEVVAERLQLGPKSAGKTPGLGETPGVNDAEPQQTPGVNSEPKTEDIPIIEEEGEIDVKDIPF